MKFEQEFINRLHAPTPDFFKLIRRVALILGAAGTALLASPVTLPAAVTAVAGYLVAAGLVATAVSSAAVADRTDTEATAADAGKGEGTP